MIRNKLALLCRPLDTMLDIVCRGEWASIAVAWIQTTISVSASTSYPQFSVLSVPEYFGNTVASHYDSEMIMTDSDLEPLPVAEEAKEAHKSEKSKGLSPSLSDDGVMRCTYSCIVRQSRFSLNVRHPSILPTPAFRSSSQNRQQRCPSLQTHSIHCLNTDHTP